MRERHSSFRSKRRMARRDLRNQQQRQRRGRLHRPGQRAARQPLRLHKPHHFPLQCNLKAHAFPLQMISQARSTGERDVVSSCEPYRSCCRPRRGPVPFYGSRVNPTGIGKATDGVVAILSLSEPITPQQLGSETNRARAIHIGVVQSGGQRRGWWSGEGEILKIGARHTAVGTILSDPPRPPV